MIDYCYDIEVYPNVFLCTVMNTNTGDSRCYEISDRKDEVGPLLGFLERASERGSRMIGFNNISYDYPVLHYLVQVNDQTMGAFHLCRKLFTKSKSIIEAPFASRFNHRIPVFEHLVTQIDLLMIHHFDNQAKATSLKVLEFNMRLDDIKELPFPPETILTHDQIEQLVKYNLHDVNATRAFFMYSKAQIEFRESLSVKYNRNFLNHNDTKIGKDYFVMELERKLGLSACFTREDGVRKPRQTVRDSIALKDVILPYVKLTTEPFRAVLEWLRGQTITQTKGVFSDLTEAQMEGFIEHSPVKGKKRVTKADRRLSVMLDGMEFVFGTGGIHASVNNTRVQSDIDQILCDLDVQSFYPSLAISNRLYPEHLGEAFCDIYADMKTQRVAFKKGTPENLMLKLALNGVYGDSNNQYSPFYDPQYTMSITVNGQLLLCMLYEAVRVIPGLSLVQMNTDGMTLKLPRKHVPLLEEKRAAWEKLTNLTLEEAVYQSMHIRDCNNYVAIYQDGKVKRKGAYEYDVEWHQNHSALVVKKAAEAAIVHGTDIREFMEQHQDDYDFLLRTKVPRGSVLLADYGFGLTEQVQNISRYWISKTGPVLVKMMPPLPKSPDKWRKISVNKGLSVEICNTFRGIDRGNLDLDWYIEQAEKLVNWEVECD